MSKSMPVLALLAACLFAAPLLNGASDRASEQTGSPRYEVIDIGTLPWVSDDVSPRISASGEISGWQASPGEPIRAGAWKSSTPQNIGMLNGFTSSIASGVNSRGQIIGWSVTGKNLVDSRETTHAFLYENSRVVDLGTLGGRDSKAIGINASGDVVGWARLPANATHAFLYRKEKLMDLGALPGGSFSAAYAINNHGLIAGAAENSTHLVHAVIWQENRIINLGTLPGGTRSRALALNDKGEIVGFSEAPGAETHAFLYSNGRMRDLGSLGDDPIRANAINNHGQIVGASGVTQLVRHAFLWENGTMQDLNKLIPADGPWRLEEAFDINDSGQILCLGVRLKMTRDRHLILLRPLVTTKPNI